MKTIRKLFFVSAITMVVILAACQNTMGNPTLPPSLSSYVTESPTVKLENTFTPNVETTPMVTMQPTMTRSLDRRPPAQHFVRMSNTRGSSKARRMRVLLVTCVGVSRFRMRHSAVQPVRHPGGNSPPAAAARPETACGVRMEWSAGCARPAGGGAEAAGRGCNSSSRQPNRSL